ncbi:hypothetical protein Q5O24_12180 [Eubacteriaceae bacterium ES3]|nr:hypothetical protein Q5O24_12180 [Eubacteriaceae bacterium ES3]
MSFRSNYIWTVDIGEESAKIVKALKTPAGIPEIEGTYQDRALCKDKLFLYKSKEQIELLSNCFDDYRRGDQINFLLKDSSIIIETFSMKPVSKTQLEDIIYWKMKKLKLEHGKKWHYDYLAEERVEVFEQLGVEEKNIDVVSVFAEQTLIRNCQSLFKAGGLKVSKVLPQFIGMGKLFKQNALKHILLLDLGYSKASLYQFRNGLLINYLELNPDLSLSFSENLSLIVRTMENQLRLFQDKREREKSLLCLVGGGSLSPGIRVWFDDHPKWELVNNRDLLAEQVAGLEGVSQTSLGIFSLGISGLLA